MLNSTLNYFPKITMLTRSCYRLLLRPIIIFMVMAFTHPSGAVELRVVDASGAPGEDVTIAVLIDDEGDTLSAGFTLRYDREILSATGAETTSLSSGFMLAHAVKWAQITVAMGDDTALTGGKGALVNVTFSISESASEGKTTITLSDPAVYDSDYRAKTVTTFDGTVTISKTTSTTTIGNQPCPAAVIYGEHSKKTSLLRYLRDNVLSQSPGGQEIIRLYYEWSPVIVEVINEDEEFKAQLKEMIDGMLPLIREIVE